jgi:hypothetical protein
MFTFAFPRRVAALALAATVVAGAAACQARDGTAGAGAPSTVSPTAAAVTASAIDDPAVRALIADVRAARAQHEPRELHRIRARLVGLIGQSAVRETEMTYRQVLADLAAADAAHDSMARARYRAQLRSLCDPDGLTSALGWCDAATSQGG